MQASAADTFDISCEPDKVKEAYGLTGPDAKAAANTNGGFRRAAFARNCLLARRLVESGVRVVQVYTGNLQPWDTHDKNAEGHQKLAHIVDQPIAALLGDLEQRGLLHDKLVV